MGHLQSKEIVDDSHSGGPVNTTLPPPRLVAGGHRTHAFLFGSKKVCARYIDSLSASAKVCDEEQKSYHNNSNHNSDVYINMHSSDDIDRVNGNSKQGQENGPTSVLESAPDHLQLHRRPYTVTVWNAADWEPAVEDDDNMNSNNDDDINENDDHSNTIGPGRTSVHWDFPSWLSLVGCVILCVDLDVCVEKVHTGLLHAEYAKAIRLAMHPALKDKPVVLLMENSQAAEKAMEKADIASALAKLPANDTTYPPNCEGGNTIEALVAFICEKLKQLHPHLISHVTERGAKKSCAALVIRSIEQHDKARSRWEKKRAKREALGNGTSRKRTGTHTSRGHALVRNLISLTLRRDSDVDAHVTADTKARLVVMQHHNSNNNSSNDDIDNNSKKGKRDLEKMESARSVILGVASADDIDIISSRESKAARASIFEVSIDDDTARHLRAEADASQNRGNSNCNNGDYVLEASFFTADSVRIDHNHGEDHRNNAGTYSSNSDNDDSIDNSSNSNNSHNYNNNISEATITSNNDNGCSARNAIPPPIVALPTKIFGKSLSVGVRRSRIAGDVPIPSVVRLCVDYLDERGMSEEGIYRLCGSKGSINDLADSFDNGVVVDLHEATKDPHVVAGLLKQYLRDLPGQIASSIRADDSDLPRLKREIDALREEERALLAVLVPHLYRVHLASEKTKMDRKNLTIVFSSTLKMSPRVFDSILMNADAVLHCSGSRDDMDCCTSASSSLVNGNNDNGDKQRNLDLHKMQDDAENDNDNDNECGNDNDNDNDNDSDTTTDTDSSSEDSDDSSSEYSEAVVVEFGVAQRSFESVTEFSVLNL